MTFFSLILKILCITLYAAYIFSIAFLLATQSISEKANDFSRWFSSEPLRKVSISTNNGTIFFYELNKHELDSLIRRFYCQKREVDDYDKAIISSHLNPLNIESVFESICNLDLVDDENIFLAYNVTVYVYELTDDRMLIHYNDSKRQDVTHQLSIKPLRKLSERENNILHFQQMICSFIFIILFFLPSLLIAANNRTSIKSTFRVFLLSFLPIVIYMTYDRSFYHSDVTILLILITTNLLVLLMGKLIKTSINNKPV
ncbi:MAG: hypothetical protein IJZ68_10990 [Bacteroidaceae bacterium]|nr:hypothetical protein [Bacteroidaceae bacterium]